MGADEARPHEYDALFWGALAKVAGDEKEAEKGLCGHRYGNGEGKYFRTPRGLKLGQIRREDPPPGWKFTDRAAFIEHVREKHPGVVETKFEVAGTAAQVVAVLLKHAPELLRKVEHIPDEVFADALKHSYDTDEPAGPGIEWDEPVGKFGVYPDKAAVEFLRQSMRLELDSLFPKALPAADDEKREAS